MEFPVFKTKVEGLARKFDLADLKERKKYFSAKAGKEIKKLKNFFRNGNTFIAYLLGKKNSGKGTYSKMFGEVVGEKYVRHLSIGDMIRNTEKEVQNKKKKRAIVEYLEKNYRGFVSIEDALNAFSRRDTKTLLPSEFILTLVKREIDKFEKKTIFIDGFPRGLDQISYSLFFRDLAGYRYDADIFVLINVPEIIIDERIKWRVICPECNTPKNLKLSPVAKENIKYDEGKKEFFFVCDNPKCKKERMVRKEGDELGIEPIKERLKLDGKLMEEAYLLHGMPKILLRNTVPAKIAKDFVDDYEITPGYQYEWNSQKKQVKIVEKPWVISDENGIPSYSLLAPPVVLSLIKQLVQMLRL